MNLGLSDSTRTGRHFTVLRQVSVILLILGASAVLSGCTTEENIPPAVVKPVTAYGITLNENATPKQVAFVLLRSIADDMQASKAHERERQEEALHLTYSVAAYSTIARRIGEPPRDQVAPESLRIWRKRVYAVVKDWAPIVGYYAPSFNTDYAVAASRMRIRSQTASTAYVLYDACHNPAATKPAERQTATIEIELAGESAGGQSYWRVARVAFAPPAAAARPTTHSAPASAPQG